MRSDSIWPFTGRTGGRRSGGSPPMPRDQAPAASTTISAASVPSSSSDALARPPCTTISLTGRCSHDLHASRLGGDAQRLRELAVVDLVVLRRKHRAGDLAGKTRLARRASPLPKAIRAADRADAEIPAGARSRPDRRRSRRAAGCPRAAVRHRCRLCAEAPRQSPASAPGSRGRARPALPRRARLRSMPPACRRRHGLRPFRPCRDRTP